MYWPSNILCLEKAFLQTILLANWGYFENARECPGTSISGISLIPS